MMKKASFLLVLIASAFCSFAQVESREQGNLYIENIPEIPYEISQTLQDYQSYRSAGLAGWHPDGKGMLFTTRFGETNQVHQINSPGQYRQQLTFFNEPVRGVQINPSPLYPGFLFLKDVGGNENYQLFHFDLKNKKYRMLSDGESRNTSPVWSRSGTKYAYASTRKNDKDYGVYLGFGDTRKQEELVLDKEGFWSPVDFAPGDQFLSIRHYKSNFDSELYILDLDNGNLTQVKEGPESAIYSGGVWSADASRLFFTTNYGTDKTQLRVYNVLNEKVFSVSDKISWNIGGLTLSPNGRYLAFQANENGVDKVYIMDTDSYSYFQLKNLPDGLVGNMAWHDDNNRLALSMSTSKHPTDIFVVNTTTQAVEQWTYSETGGLIPDKCIEPELVFYPTFDKKDGAQRVIPAYYYQPTGQIGPYPTLIYIHGGPESQFRPGYNPLFQYLVNELGIAILAPNVRGSDGYGKNYLMADNGYNREKSVKDIGALLDWIETRPELDESNVAVMGGSYGGYMVLASLVHYGERIKCAVEAVGISSFVTFLENTKAYRRDLRRAEYGDERDPKMREFLTEISPLTNVAKINTPLLVVQGLNDPRVPASESEQILKAVRENGGKAWYILAKDEGHGFRKKSNRDFYQASMVLFFKEFMGLE
jgi:dipeptidyl aminopeptidase/acylaminoacyl peptidase